MDREEEHVRPWIGGVVCLFAMITSAQAAQEQQQETGTDVVVTATRLPTPAAEVASSVTVITSEEIERKQQRTLSDVLRDIPGLSLVQTGGPGGLTSVFIRGTNSNHTKVFIDGIDVVDPSTADGAFDFGHLLASDIERVEVLRGPQSGLYGSDAIGGVINIVTGMAKELVPVLAAHDDVDGVWFFGPRELDRKSVV